MKVPGPAIMHHMLLFKLLLMCLLQHVSASPATNNSESRAPEQHNLDLMQALENSDSNSGTVKEPSSNYAENKSLHWSKEGLTNDNNNETEKSSKHEILNDQKRSAIISEQDVSAKNPTKEQSKIWFGDMDDHNEPELAVHQDDGLSEQDTPAAIVESEGLFTVNTSKPAKNQLEEDFESEIKESSYSGDGLQEIQTNSSVDGYDDLLFDYLSTSSGDGQIESQASSGDGDFTISPIPRLEASRIKGSGVEKPSITFPDKNTLHVHASGQRLRCEELICEKYHHLKVSVSSVGGMVIPTGTMVALRCTAQTLLNDTAVIKWHLPPRMISGADNNTINGNVHSEVEKRINVTEVAPDFKGANKRVTISTLTVINITEEDAGQYICEAILTKQCCQTNLTLGIRVYTPPSYAVDFAIVGAVCFVEFLIILYFKTRTDKQNRPKDNTNRSGNGFSTNYQPIPLETKSKEIQIEEEEQERLT